jgi:hypothetical protein
LQEYAIAKNRIKVYTEVSLSSAPVQDRKTYSVSHKFSAVGELGYLAKYGKM